MLKIDKAMAVDHKCYVDYNNGIAAYNIGHLPRKTSCVHAFCSTFQSRRICGIQPFDDDKL